MKHRVGDLFAKENLDNLYAVICITTNGTVSKKTGELVMGKGIALEAKKLSSGLPSCWGLEITTECTNLVQELPATKVYDYSDTAIWSMGLQSCRFYAFQTKTKWWEPSSYELIKKSIETLRACALENPEDTFFLPIPGCGNGGLDPNLVVPMLFSLPDNVVLVTEKPLAEILNHTTNSSMSLQPYHD